MVCSGILFSKRISILCCGIFFGFRQSIVLIHIIAGVLRLLLALASFFARQGFLGVLISCFGICLEVVDPFVVAFGVCGLSSCRINVSQTRVIFILLVGLGNAGSDSWCWSINMLL